MNTSQYRYVRHLLLSAFIACSARSTCAFTDTAQASVSAYVLSATEFQNLLQRFVDKAYLKAFRHLGDERDFDHGHILYDPRSNRPQAILYHTQEMAKGYPRSSEYGYVDPDARNWIQWIHEDKIENAVGYQRKNFPRSAFWAWFVERRLPTLRSYHTIIDKMLDPALVGAQTEHSLQWVFTRIDCSRTSSAPLKQGNPIDITLPTGEVVCLTLSDV